MLDELEEDIDDSDADPDYANNSGNSSSSSGSEDDVVDEAIVNRKEKKKAEVRVYMHPPAEKADGGTDKDSGLKYFFIIICFQFFKNVQKVFCTN